MSQSSNLYRLQLLDSQLDQARHRMKEIEGILNQDAELKQTRQAHDEANLNLNDEQKHLRHAEEAVQDLRIKIEQTEAMLYGGKIRNPKELQDLQAEVEALIRYLVTLEDRELEAMLTLENAEEQLKNASQNLTEAQSRFASQYALLNGERHKLSGQIDRLETERQAAVNTIKPDDMVIYEQLRKQRRGIAVAIAVDKSCSACGSLLTAALIQQAVTSPLLVRCPTCGRIIYPG